jgi:hypothetical protein
MSEERATLTRHRPGWRWLVLALAFASIGYAIIRELTREPAAADSELVVGVVRSGKPLDVTQKVQLNLHGEALEVSFELIAHQSAQVLFGLSGVEGKTPCQAVPRQGRAIFPEITLRMATPQYLFPLGLDAFKSNVSGVEYVTIETTDAPSDATEIDVECHLSVVPSHTSYSLRRVRVRGLHEQTIFREATIDSPLKSLNGDFWSPQLQVDFGNMANLSSFRVDGGSAIGTQMTNRERKLDSLVTADWQDERSVELRDLLLLIAGAMFGISGACLVEWLRPWIDR